MSVLEKASDLIDCLGQAGEPVTLAYVRSALDMPKSSTHRMLSELTGLGIVRRTPDGRYSLGPRLLYWGEAAADSFDLRAVAEQPMRRLRDDLGESVHLYVREQDTRICIAAVEARHELRPFIQLGRALPLRVGAAGKLLLAFAESEVIAAELQRARRDRGTLPNAPGVRLGEQLERIRSERWATSVGEREEGVSAIAAPISDSRGRVVAAVSVSAPTTRLGPERFGELRPPLEQCAAEISSLLRSG
jgi:DNA-binding IclR family transcriptional regulator